MFHDQFKVPVRVAGRQFNELRRRFDRAELLRIVQRGVHIGIDQFDRLGAIVVGSATISRKLRFERGGVAVCLRFAGLLGL